MEIAWALTALTIDPQFLTDSQFAEKVAGRLVESFNGRSGLFAHWPGGVRSWNYRNHVTCFADWVYPVQALSHYHLLTRSQQAIDVAARSADRMCRLQGEGGQWWWHYDVRTGAIIEPYPVYAVHQDAMAPMALLALRDACGVDHSEAIHRGLAWLFKPSERTDSLIDREAGLIWRKVARHEPGKLTRGVQALMSRLHPSVRIPGTGVVFPPCRIDYECRPYHLGWLLYAFPDNPEKVY